MKEKNYVISLIRLTSFFMIVSCHICQFYGNELAWWLNCGVQVFLLMSGYLYGQRKDIDARKFYARNIPKILVDYYIYLAVMLPIYILIVRQKITAGQFVKLTVGIGTDIPGLGHLWYISTILSCYLMTPFVVKLIRPNISWVKLVYLFVVIEMVCMVVPGFTGAWINCYIIGVLIGNAKTMVKEEKRYFNVILALAVPSAIILCGTEILVKYVIGFELVGLIGRGVNTIFHYGHIALAVVIFVSGLRFLHLGLSERGTHLLDTTDEYIYDAYIVHLFYVLGPYSLFHGKSRPLDIVGGGVFC